MILIDKTGAISAIFLIVIGSCLLLAGLITRGGLAPIFLVPLGFIMIIISIGRLFFATAPSDEIMVPDHVPEPIRDPKKISDEIHDEIKATDFIKQW